MAQTRLGAQKTAAKHAGLSLEEYHKRLATGLKRCTACKEWLSVSEYHPDQSRVDGLKAACKTCCRDKQRRYPKGQSQRPTRRARYKDDKKRCRACGVWKKAEKYEPRASVWDGRRSVCRKCANKLSRMKRAPHIKPRRKRGQYKLNWHRNAVGWRGTFEYRWWRQQVLERDHWTCQECGRVKCELHAHHIKPAKRFPNLILDVSNGKTLCRTCHHNTHRRS